MAFPIHPQWHLAPAHGERERVYGPWVIHRLRDACREPHGRSALRQAALELGLLDEIARRSDEEICQRVAAAIERGRLTFVERAPTLRAPGGIAEREEIETPAATTVTSNPVKTWIEIELIGEDDQPIPNERYRIEPPDGSVREGTLNARGFARVDGLDPGTCKVTFPDLDAEAWKPA